MSAPDTNLKKQKRRHFGPIAGISAVLAIVAVMFLGYLAYNASGDPPAPASESEPGAGLPAETAPATPQDPGGDTPQVIEPQPTPPAD